jgi:spermidine synthase
MSQPNAIETASLPAARRFLPLLLVLFVGSGFAALIYEIVWFQLVQRVIGSSGVSLAVLLGTFMGGMCLGSLALPRFVSARHHPLRVYAFIELGIAFFGLVLLIGMPHVDRMYATIAGSGFHAVLLRGAVCAVCLLPPTMLMGATLPAIARWVEPTPQGISWLGLFYGGNIAGAVVGCLFAGFYLLRVFDLTVATHVAASVNAAVGVLALGLQWLTVYDHAGRGQATRVHLRVQESLVQGGDDARRGGPASKHSEVKCVAWSVYVAIALSGASALAAEVIWTRLLSLMLGATVYTLSIILAVFLIGLGIGSGGGSFLARATPHRRLLLATCQVLLAGAVFWGAYMLTSSLPYWPINPRLGRSPWHLFQLDLVRCAWAILPATCLWGASFPLALAAGAAPGQDPGRLAGGMYAANAVGAIVGALGASLLLIPWLGTQQAQRILIGLSAVAALVVLLPYLSPLRALRLAAAVVVAASIAGVSAFLVWSVPCTPWELVAFGRSLPSRPQDHPWQDLYVGEGMNSSVAVTQYGNSRNFHVSGKVEASTDLADMRLQRMLGHIPALLHAKPRSVLVVGCGAGVTAGCFVVHPEVEKIVICEIEPLVPRAVAPFFTQENHDVVNDPRVEIVHDDARHYILTTRETFDIITSDPIHPWVKGSAALYTREYFELCKRRLNPGGLITQWVPLYETSESVVKSEFATFFDVFPEGTIWSNYDNGAGFDIVVLGQAERLTIDADRVQARLDLPDHAAARRSLEEVGFQTVVGLFSIYDGRARDLGPWLENTEINLDHNLRLQYLAGMELNTDQRGAIFIAIQSYRKYPEDLFTGSGLYAQATAFALRKSIAAFRAPAPAQPTARSP